MLAIFRQMLDAPFVGDWSLIRRADLDSFADLRGAVTGEAGEPDSEDAGDDSYWAVALPVMRVFDQGDGGYFGRDSESGKILRGSMFRRISPQARIRIGAGGIERSAPPGPVGAIPLATLVAPVSIFHDVRLRSHALSALRTFATSDPDLSQLDDLIPWGPQFVTGHTYDRPAIGGRPPSPIRWANLHERRDASINTRVEQLAGLFGPGWRGVFERFADMLDGNRFAVGWLPSSDVSAAIDAYVRINRAGIRVRAEECALALLSRAHPGLLDDLAEFASLRDDEPVSDQRSLLTHESDRQLGFAVWMSTVTRYATLALLGTSGLRWLGTSAIDKATFGYRLDRVGPRETATGKKTWARDYAAPRELIEECSARATRALLLVDSILSNELFLDHRMARPSTRPLTPLIDLLYRLPASAQQILESDPNFRAAIARLFRWTLLAPYIDQADLEQLLIHGHGIDEAVAEDLPIPVWDSGGESWREQVRQALGRYQTSLAALWLRKRAGVVERYDWSPLVTDGLSTGAKLNELALEAFRIAVTESRSLQHTAVGWLYAIERRGCATEFLWQAQYAGYMSDHRTGIRPGNLRKAVALRRAVGADIEGLYPEKQHIVPFSSARQIVNKGGTRATASPANAIGNLTWLSRRQNGLDGLADRWAVMDPGRDGANLHARGMFARAKANEGPQIAVGLYEQIRDAMLMERDPVGLQPLFASFCAARREWMIEQMRSWLQEPLSDEAREWLPE